MTSGNLPTQPFHVRPDQSFSKPVIQPSRKAMKLLKSANNIAMLPSWVLAMLLILGGSLIHAGAAPSEVEIAKIRSKAEQGDADSQAQLADLYRYGKGVKKDFQQSFQWAAKAADQGNAQAQHYLGICYKYEMGVKKDLVEAFQWFKKSAEQGYVNAQYRVGECYLKGDGVPRYDELGVEWLEKAANQGDVDAKFLLGKHYAHKAIKEKKDLDDFTMNSMPYDPHNKGLYQHKNAMSEQYHFEGSFFKSYFWFNLALAGGNKEAQKELDAISKRMSLESINTAQQASANWKPNP